VCNSKVKSRVGSRGDRRENETPSNNSREGGDIELERLVTGCHQGSSAVCRGMHALAARSDRNSDQYPVVSQEGEGEAFSGSGIGIGRGVTYFETGYAAGTQLCVSDSKCSGAIH
jgi:hypothetical protein